MMFDFNVFDCVCFVNIFIVFFFEREGELGDKVIGKGLFIRIVD